MRCAEQSRPNPALLPTLRPNSVSARSRLRSLSPSLKLILREVRREIGLTAQDHEGHSEPELKDIIHESAGRLGFELGSHECEQILAHLERSQKLFGILEPLVRDPHTSDVIVTGFANIAVQQSRRNLSTDLSFADQSEYEDFVERLLCRSGVSYSTKQPFADGMIGSYARIHAVHKSLCESGPYLTIRLNRFPSISLDDLKLNKTAPGLILDYLSSLARWGNSLLIVGEVGTGKTTLLRALAASLPTSESILVIEDTPEIRLEHPHVRYVRTRGVNSDEAGRITPVECIRAGMRMAMNRIVFGEMRDAEAAEAFVDVCASGHPGLSTLHARSCSEAVARLELFLGRAQIGVSRNVIFEQISKAVQVLVHVGCCPKSGRRQIWEIREIGPVADGIIRHRVMFQYRDQGEREMWETVTRASRYRDCLERDEFDLANLPRFLN